MSITGNFGEDSRSRQGKMKQNVSRKSAKGRLRNAGNEERVLVKRKEVNQS